MRYILFAVVLGFLFASTATYAATDTVTPDADEIGTTDCDVVQWNYYQSSASPTIDGKFTVIEGRVECAKGMIQIKAYNGSGQLFAVGASFIEDHQFDAEIPKQPPETMTIKYRASDAKPVHPVHVDS